MAIFLFFVTTLGLTGCGDSGNNAEFVVTNPPAQANTGDLTFNFVTAQEAFTVDSDTARLRFRFYENAGALGEPVVDTTVNFQPTITSRGLPTTIQSVRITGLDASGIPLFTIIQQVTVVGGQNTTVAALGDVVPVVLDDLALVSADSVGSPQLEQIDLEVNGTGQVYLLAIYSDGTQVVVGDAATYSNDPADPDSAQILQVGESGQLRGLSPGQTNLIVEFAGQTLTAPVQVEAVLEVTFEAIGFINVDPLTVPAGGAAQASLVGVRASDGFLFGINPANPNLAYSIAGDAGISVTSDGVIIVADVAPGGSQATLTAVYNNANNTTVSASLDIIVSGDAGVDTIAAAASVTNLYTGVPVFTSQINITETLTDGTTRPGNPADYTFISDSPSVATVSAAGVVSPAGAGVAVITATLTNNPLVSATVNITVESASVVEVSIEPPTPSIPAGQSQTFQLLATLSNGAGTEIDVTNISGFALSGAGAASFSVVGSVVSVAGNAVSGTQATVTGSFDPDGAGAFPPATAVTTITAL
jgi:hypothetical protein